jgi:hypothetical protein
VRILGLTILVATACGDTRSVNEPNGYEGNARIVAHHQGGARAIAANADALYWVTGTDVVALAHGASEATVLASGLTEPMELCVTSSDVYAITSGTGGILGGGVTIPGGVVRVPLGGGAVEEVYRPDTYGPEGIACDDAGVFWTQLWSSLTTPSGLMGLVDGRPTLLVDEALPNHLALDASNIYWSSDKQLMRASRVLPLVGEAITTSPGFPERLTIHRGELFWISPSNSNEPAALLATSGPIASVPDQVTLHYSIAVDDDFVYWTEFEPGRIMRVSRGGGEPEVFADGQGGPTDIVLHEGAVYWTNYTTGNVVTL